MHTPTPLMLGFLSDFLSPTHMIVILVIALLVFGHRLPEVGRSLGRGIVEFKKGLKGIDDEVANTRPGPDRRLEETSASYHNPPAPQGGQDPRVPYSNPYRQQSDAGTPHS